MNYRETKHGRWAKPVGYHLFTFEEDRNEWTNWFKDPRGEMGRREVHQLKNLTDDTKDYLLYMLKEWEAFTVTYNSTFSSFELPVVDL